MVNRFAAWIAIAATLWLTAGVLVFYMADLVEAVVQAAGAALRLEHRTAAASFSVLIPFLSSLAGFASRGSGAPRRPSTLRRAVQALALPLIILALLATVAWFNAWALRGFTAPTPGDAAGQLPGVSDFHHGASGCERDGQPVVHDADRRPRGGARADPRRGGTVWRALVPRDAERARDRRAHGARRPGEERPLDVRPAGWAGRVTRRGRGSAGGSGSHEVHPDAVVRRPAPGRGYVCRNVRRDACRRAARYLPARRASRVDPVVALRTE